jgi:DtxR family Mn-dependent transcriptional regulator
MLSSTEENYLKAIFQLSEKQLESISTNAIAEHLQTSAASVTDMLKRLTDKGLTLYEKYKGVRLSTEGRKIATQLVRKHRLWETFMVDILGFTWDEVHPIAEQLEHIQSEELVNRLERFLGYPKFDPHGDPIPDAEGNFTYLEQMSLADLPILQRAVVVGVRDHSPAFLKYLAQLQLQLGAEIELQARNDYDHSLMLLLGKQQQIITYKVAQNLMVQRLGGD